MSEKPTMWIAQHDGRTRVGVELLFDDFDEALEFNCRLIEIVMAVTRQTVMRRQSEFVPDPEARGRMRTGNLTTGRAC